MNDLRDEIVKNWEAVARELLAQEKSKKSLMRPEPVGVLVLWQDGTYIGSIQKVVPEFSEEIVALSKSSNPLPVYLADAVRKLDPERLELGADNELDLTGRQHILRRLKDRLTRMTQEQTAYMLLHPPTIHEI